MSSIQCLLSVFLRLLQTCVSTWYSSLFFYGIHEVVISLFIRLPIYVNSTLPLPDVNLQFLALSLSPIIFTVFPLNPLLFFAAFIVGGIFRSLLFKCRFPDHNVLPNTRVPFYTAVKDIQALLDLEFVSPSLDVVSDYSSNSNRPASSSVCSHFQAHCAVIGTKFEDLYSPGVRYVLHFVCNMN